MSNENENEKPLYANDCDACVFLGRERGHDLYFCPQPGLGLPTVIARYGEGPKYNSGLALAEHDPILRAARALAIERGLLT